MNSGFEIHNCLLAGTERASSGRGLGSHELVEAKKATISKILKAGKEIPLRSSQQPSAERVFSWMGVLLYKRRLSWSGECVSMQLFSFDGAVVIANKCQL